MPIYDYNCQACGPFTAMQTMAHFRDPCACPECGAGAPRASLSLPGIAMHPVRGGAHTAGEPRRASAAHPAGCGCCARRWPLPAGLSAGGGRVFTAHGPVRRGGA